MIVVFGSLLPVNFVALVADIVPALLLNGVMKKENNNMKDSSSLMR